AAPRRTASAAARGPPGRTTCGPDNITVVIVRLGGGSAGETPAPPGRKAFFPGGPWPLRALFAGGRLAGAAAALVGGPGGGWGRADVGAGGGGPAHRHGWRGLQLPPAETARRGGGRRRPAAAQGPPPRPLPDRAAAAGATGEGRPGAEAAGDRAGLGVR